VGSVIVDFAADLELPGINKSDERELGKRRTG
jgi:hypothetical protein